MTATVIVAAHNEEGVIARTLSALSDVVATKHVRVIVVCNGCTDATSAVARRFPGVEVVDLRVPSKVHALREGDRLAGGGPRIYLDADVVLTSRAARALISALTSGALAGRPVHKFDTSGASFIIRRWYRVREELPSIASALWGAGCYGLSEAGRARFGQFPDVVADDLFVDAQFAATEVTIIDTDPVVVSTPRKLADLFRILRRSYRTQTEIVPRAHHLSTGQRAQLGDLLSLVSRSPRRLGDVVIYVAVIAWARLLARIPTTQQWERDQSSREII